MNEFGSERREKEKFVENKIILISEPTPEVLDLLNKEFFNDEMKGKSFAYLPCEGDNPNNPKYSSFWQEKVKEGDFFLINNAKSFEDSLQERKIVESADYLMIPGGNTFVLLNNLRKSGLFESVQKFFNKGGKKYLGMSAGAIILGPSIEVAGYPGFSLGHDENVPNLTDMSALGIIDFVPIPHYDAEKDKEALELFQNKDQFKVKPISDDDIVSFSNEVKANRA